VPKRQEVDAYVDIERGLKGGRCGRLDQAVHAETRMETDVIGDEDVVEADPGDMLQAGSPIGVRASQHFCVGENTDL
jgi:N-methylhydantoinase B/oxoprolinase/acetone carboxylase alpha subunit